MFLKSLTLNGFKAFAEKTVITFQEGICGLIGPNGCGKSNVIDAIKWVVGEQKISELRSDKMEDVIFHGSEGETICNMAEVEMVVANENSILPIEYSEISIIRRLYRSGESEYLLNKKPCRLKDIHHLFLETGIGKSTSSVIEQGRIDKVLSMNPEDRRYIFEEAAGVVKYRERKKEYQRKIEKTKENLKRVSDLVGELERQKSQLKKQADISKKYFELQENLKAEEIKRFLYQLLQYRKKKNAIENNIEQSIKIIAEQEELLKEAREGEKNIKEQIQSKEENITRFEKKKIEVDERLHSSKVQSSMFAERINEINQNIKERQETLIRSQEEKKNLYENIKTLSKEIENKQIKKESNKKKITGFTDQIKELSSHIESCEIKRANFKQRTGEIKKETIELNKKHFVVVENLIKEIDALKQKVQEDEKIHLEDKRRLLDFQKSFKEKLSLIFDLQSDEQMQSHINQIGTSEKGDLKSELEKVYLNLFELKKTADEYELLLKKFLRSDDPFYELIFSAEGTYAQKEKVDSDLAALQQENQLCEQKIEFNAAEIKKCQSQVSEIKQQRTEIEIDQATVNQSIELSLRIKDEKVAGVNNLEVRYVSAKNYLAKQNDLLTEFLKKKKDDSKERDQLEKENAKLIQNLSAFSKIIESESQRLNKNREKIDKRETLLNSQTRKRDHQIVEVKLLEKDIENLCEQATNQYSENLPEKEKNIINQEFNPESIRKKIESYREQLKSIGRNVNPLAQDEYESIVERLDEVLKQEKDIIRSMEDLNKVVEEIDANSSEIFYSTFKKIQTNFHLLFRRLFDGGAGKVVLTDEKNPLESGINILIQPPGKKIQNINLLSGGEKSLIAIALMFSVFLVRPSPICLLDEVDAALDKINIDRLSKMLFEFRQVTQFVIITHNEKTASITDYMHGVTMSGGVSKVYSYKFKVENQSDR